MLFHTAFLKVYHLQQNLRILRGAAILVAPTRNQVKMISIIWSGKSPLPIQFIYNLHPPPYPPSKKKCNRKKNHAYLNLAYSICNRVNDTHMEELDSVQKLIEIQSWLLLTFFIWLHNQFDSFNSTIVQVSEKHDSSSRQ